MLNQIQSKYSEIFYAKRSFALELTALFVILGLIWVWFSDWLIFRLTSTGADIFHISALKGTLFIFLAAIFLYTQLERKYQRNLALTSLLAAISERAGDAIFVKDLNGKYVFVNNACCSLFERKWEDIIGFDDNDFFPANQVSAIVATDS